MLSKLSNTPYATFSSELLTVICIPYKPDCCDDFVRGRCVSISSPVALRRTVTNSSLSTISPILLLHHKRVITIVK